MSALIARRVPLFPAPHAPVNRRRIKRPRQLLALALLPPRPILCTMPKHRYSNYYAHPKKAGAPRKPRAPPKKKLDYEDDAEIIGVLPDDARLDLPTRDCGRKPRAQPKKLDDAEIIGTLPDDAPTRSNPMKGTNVFKFDFKSEAPAAGNRNTTTTTRKRQRDAEEDTDGHDGDDEKESRVTVAREVAGTKRRKLRV
ncbi:hypothetical protein EXIGLDRAFT_726986 [Exidia glandulosa HHB12029]|uniref:Uncharacterized protein n=1 Tax=Exidia glandulosa HHB12029 TaxID=1314781 RepID=A0A165DIL9_EXIGL|nr:hypothetical protein EXIGLDRAFT_726986 [Exidia glandulosa HHB12029]